MLAPICCVRTYDLRCFNEPQCTENTTHLGYIWTGPEGHVQKYINFVSEAPSVPYGYLIDMCGTQWLTTHLYT